MSQRSHAEASSRNAAAFCVHTEHRERSLLGISLGHLARTERKRMTDLNLLSFNPTKHSDTKTHKATGMQQSMNSSQSSAPLPSAYTSGRANNCPAEWQGKKSIQVNDHALPLLSDPVNLPCKRTRRNRHVLVILKTCSTG